MPSRALRLPEPAVRRRGQALVELALVMPVLVGIVAALFQFGILFIAYLSMVHEMRDIGRWAAVHPDTIDGTSCSTPSSLWAQACADLPSVVASNHITLSVLPGADGVTRSCSSLTSGHCALRPAGAELRMRLAYDAATIVFLPSTFRLGPYLNVSIPTTLPAYDYSVMVEQH
ncbi:MAG: pilus assembly protein [Chloroflexota bacterium]|nr:pilus assembly protein [Chloroflexota bacterium]